MSAVPKHILCQQMLHMVIAQWCHMQYQQVVCSITYEWLVGTHYRVFRRLAASFLIHYLITYEKVETKERKLSFLSHVGLKPMQKKKEQQGREILSSLPQILTTNTKGTVSEQANLILRSN